MPLLLDGVPIALQQQVAAALRGLAPAQDSLVVRVQLTTGGWRVSVVPEGPSLLPQAAHDDVAEMMAVLLNTTMPNRLRG